MSSHRILIVDDDPLQRELLREYLEISGFEVDEADNGKTALAGLRGRPADLVILDLQMPVMDGFSTLKALQEQPGTATIPVLMLTSHDRPNLKVKGLELGAEDYITKPFHQAELLARVKAALRRNPRHEENDGRLFGDLSTLGLFDLLATLELSGRDAQVELPELAATVRLAGGRFQDAGLAGFSGPDALTRILLLARGTFVVQFRSVPGEDAGAGHSVSALLLDAARSIDEWTRVLPELANPDRWFEPRQDGDLPAWMARLLPAPVSRILSHWPEDAGAGLEPLRRLIDEGRLVALTLPCERNSP
ncbi:response regulator [Myxococcota bacterium]|nr:response regulator [Myxococcota bacterium]MBU1412377.1 response regulator [Myxococcota bacterium]MBU1510970.1 response regulator [Myxococcota bacterium]PKN27160.1 MAG: hypothetical protein CVU65_03425 [Deltaproteobacteria bacterium HGW-Deltaproteobacteria-22]